MIALLLQFYCRLTALLSHLYNTIPAFSSQLTAVYCIFSQFHRLLSHFIRIFTALPPHVYHTFFALKCTFIAQTIWCMCRLYKSFLMKTWLLKGTLVLNDIFPPSVWPLELLCFCFDHTQSKIVVAIVCSSNRKGGETSVQGESRSTSRLCNVVTFGVI